jgi:hypothetical protein
VVRAEGTTLIFNGLDWVGSAIDALALQNVNGVGINTTADDVNRLAVSADATLLSHNGSDHRVVVNKDAPTDTASLLFQTGYSGRAEMGTAGGDDFSIKVSNDSMSWNTSLTLDGATGRAEFPSGAQVACRVDIGGCVYCYTDNRWVTHHPAFGVQTENLLSNGGNGAEPAVSWEDMSALVSQKSRLTTLEVALRSNSTEVTGYDLHVYYQTGLWGAGWTSDGSVTRTLVGSVDNATSVAGFNRVTVDLGRYEVQDDGFVVVFFAPYRNNFCDALLLHLDVPDLLIAVLMRHTGGGSIHDLPPQALDLAALLFCIHPLAFLVQRHPRLYPSLGHKQCRPYHLRQPLPCDFAVARL